MQQHKEHKYWMLNCGIRQTNYHQGKLLLNKKLNKKQNGNTWKKDLFIVYLLSYNNYCLMLTIVMQYVSSCNNYHHATSLKENPQLFVDLR
jgi:hypothetical protein